MSTEKKNTNRWLAGLLAGMLTTVIPGSMWVGALAARVTDLEAAAAVQATDHDIIVRLDVQQRQILKELEAMNKKLDKLSGDE